MSFEACSLLPVRLPEQSALVGRLRRAGRRVAFDLFPLNPVRQLHPRIA